MNHHRPILVANLGQFSKVGYDTVVAVTEIAPGENPGTVDRHRLANYHRRPATGALGVITNMTLAWQTVLGHVGGMRAKVEPVLERLVTNLQRLEQMGKQFRHEHLRGAER